MRRNRRTDCDEVTGGDGALHVEPVFDLVQLAVIIAVEGRGHLASNNEAHESLISSGQIHSGRTPALL